jgi:hypothetical protein
MSTDGLTVMRLLLAAINGALFAFGLFLLVEHLYRRPRQLKLRMKDLIVRAERTERQERDGTLRVGDPTSRELREQVDLVKDELGGRKQNPKFIINVAFAALMILLATFSLLSLLFPMWLKFA